MFNIEFAKSARKASDKLLKSDVFAFKKLQTLIEELKVHPYTGTGHPKPLSADKSGQWSRKITEKQRLVYLVKDDILIVLIIAVSGHYGDK